jgi:hypothetical protein
MQHFPSHIIQRIWVSILCYFAGVTTQGQFFDLAPFARPCPAADQYTLTTTFDNRYLPGSPFRFEPVGNRHILGLQWAEERDALAIDLEFATPYAGKPIKVEYWFQNWPYSPPELPNIEDPVDDPWQGRWLRAKTEVRVEGNHHHFTFQPLKKEENPHADNLPGLRYRRAIKIRLIAEAATPTVQQLQVFSASTAKTVTLRLELGVTGATPIVWDGKLEAYNGAISNVHGWQTAASDQLDGPAFKIQTAQSAPRKGLVFDVLGTSPAPSGSHDVTLVTVRAAERTFSFALPDVEKGPLYLPPFDCYVTLASDAKPFDPAIVKAGQRIRQKLAQEPEQTYERARREIPPLDPVKRQGGRLYLPLTLAASWQKFALAWGGNVFVHKGSMKAKGEELRRLEWEGDRIDWKFGTGAEPTFRPEAGDSTMSVAEDYLPIATATWKTGDLEYVEETFASALAGPLGCAGRDELSPVVLLMKLTTRNTGSQTQPAHLWLGITPAESLRFENHELLALDGQLVRARVTPTPDTQVKLAEIKSGDATCQGIHLETSLAPGATTIAHFALPLLPRLTPAQREQLAALDFDRERARVAAFWRSIVEPSIRFEVPEQRFVSFSRAMLAHMHLSTTKDPKSGLFMVPAAAYDYQVFANESCFQTMTLDILGDHQTAADYLETFIRLQGSHPFPGAYTGDQSAVYHGAKVDDERDYTASDYNLDHGTVLWALAEHYFRTRDAQWLRHATPGMIRAADWVTEQRRQTMRQENGQPVPEYGLLPAGHLEDNPDWAHWFAINAYASAGMTRLGEALKETGHPEAERLGRDAATYRTDLRHAVLRASQNAPVTRLRDNTYAPYVPVRPHQRQRLFGPLRVDYYRRYPEPVLPNYRLSATREVLYGPLILVYLGIFDPREPLAEWVLDDWEDNLTMSTSFGLNVHGWVADEYWFSRGGMVFQANLQNPINAYLRRHEIPAAIRNLYNDFVACHYPEVNAFTEEYRDWHSPSGPFYKVPDEARFVTRLREMLVREDGADLWLTSGTPRRWLAAGETIRLRQMPTLFGTVDLELKAGETEIAGEVRLPADRPMANAWLVLRAPESKTLGAVEINGVAATDVNSVTGQIRLPAGTQDTLKIRAKLLAK